MLQSPVLRIVALLALVFVCGSLFAFMGASLAKWIWGIEDISAFFRSAEAQAEHPYAILLVQGIGAIGAFLVPGLLYPLFQAQRPFRYYKMERGMSLSLLILGIGVIFFCQPMIAYSAQLNKMLQVPEAMGSLSRWLDEANQQVQEGYESLLNFQSIGQMLVTLLVVAVLPAIGEEVVFRGAIQQELQRSMRSRHMAVWLAALIFSLFHFQVYFFLPRLLLGAAIGYLFAWSGNLWYAIAVHFLNNAWVVVAAYFLMGEGKSFTELQTDGMISPSLAIISTSIFLVFLVLFRMFSPKPEPENDH